MHIVRELSSMPISGHCVGSALPDERQPPFAPPCAPRLSPDGALLVLTKVPSPLVVRSRPQVRPSANFIFVQVVCV